MLILMKIFPFSFGARNKANFIIRIIIYAVVALGTAILLGSVRNLVLLTVALRTLGSFTELYVVCGIALLVLDYKQILK